MSEDHVVRLRASRLIVRDGIAEFSHQCPSTRNSIGVALRDDYIDMLGVIEDSRDIETLILTGSGGSFCSGANLQRLGGAGDAAPGAQGQRDFEATIKEAHVWLQRLRELPIPVIAAVDGAAAGAGFSLALAADFVLASPRAMFCMSFAKIGLIPDLAALYQLPRIVGLSAAKDIAMTARRISAEEAKRLGIVHAVHAADELIEATWRFAKRFGGVPRTATGITKRLLNQSFETSYVNFVRREARGQAVAAAEPYFREAVDAFLAGKAPRFDWDRT